MEKFDQKTLDNFIKKHGWLKFNELATPTGKQHMYMTPAGNIAVVLYGLSGELISFGTLVATPLPGGPGGALLKPR